MFPKQSKKAIGNYGEDLATKWLTQNNFIILDRNYKIKKGEIDIIATKNNVYYFIEVKLRTTEDPIESINFHKIKMVERTAVHWMQNLEDDVEWSICALLLTPHNKNQTEWNVEWIEDLEP